VARRRPARHAPGGDRRPSGRCGPAGRVAIGLGRARSHHRL